MAGKRDDWLLTAICYEGFISVVLFPARDNAGMKL